MRIINKTEAKNIFKDFQFLYFLFFTVLLCTFLLFFATENYIIILPLTVIALLLGVLSSLNLNILYLSFLLSSLFYLKSDDGITTLDLIYFSFFLVISILLVVELLKNPKENITNRLDYAVLSLYAIFSGAIFVGILFSSSIYSSISEITWYSPLFGFFFYKKLFRDPFYKKALFTIILGIVIFVAIRNIINYQSILIQASLAWQVERARIPTNEAILLFGCVFFLVNTFLSQKKLFLIPSLLLFGLCFFGLVITQSRGYWLAFIVSCGVIFLLADSQKKTQILLSLAVLAMITSVAAITLYQDSLELFISGLSYRLSSFSNILQDSSLIDRINESKSVINRISDNPIIGYGFGTTFKREVTFFNNVRYTSFIHNGYLLVMFKFGIIGLIAFLTYSYQIFSKGYRIYKNSVQSNFTHIVIITILSTFSGMLVVNLTSPQFYHFDSILLICLFSAFVSANSQKKKDESGH